MKTTMPTHKYIFFKESTQVASCSAVELEPPVLARVGAAVKHRWLRLQRSRSNHLFYYDML